MSRIQPKLWGTTSAICVLSHTCSLLLRLLKGTIYTPAVVPEPSIRERIDQGYQVLLVFPLSAASGNTQSIEEQYLHRKQKQNLSAQRYNLAPCDQLKLDVHLKKGIWKAPHQDIVRPRCDSEQNNSPYTFSCS